MTQFVVLQSNCKKNKQVNAKKIGGEGGEEGGARSPRPASVMVTFTITSLFVITLASLNSFPKLFLCH